MLQVDNRGLPALGGRDLASLGVRFQYAGASAEQNSTWAFFSGLSVSTKPVSYDGLARSDR